MYPRLKNTLLILLLVILPIAILVPEYAGGPVTFVAQLGFGWIFYLASVLPRVEINWPAVATTVLAATAFLALAHTFAHRVYREIRLSRSPGTPEEERGSLPSTILHLPSSSCAPHPAWPLRWTLAAAATLLLMFTAGLAATGITHHTARLASMGAPIFQSGNGGRVGAARRILCMTHLREIGVTLIHHAQTHGGHFPARLEDLLDDKALTPDTFIYPSAEGVDDDSGASTHAAPPDLTTRLREGHATYVYLTPNLKYPSPTRIPIVTEPLANHDGAGLCILYSDGSVQWHKPDEAQKILAPNP